MDQRLHQDQHPVEHPIPPVLQTAKVEVAKLVAKDGVKVSFHITPGALSFTLAFLIAVVSLIVYLTDKPSRAETNAMIDLKQQPVIERIDGLKSSTMQQFDQLRTSVDGYHQEVHDYLMHK